MAERDYWFITEDNKIGRGSIDFIWVPGMHISRRRISCMNMFAELKERLGMNALDASTASPTQLGRDVGALGVYWYGRSVEAWYVGSIIKEGSTQADHSYYSASAEYCKFQYKKEPHGRTIGFDYLNEFRGDSFTLGVDSAMAFYDWLYLNAVYQQHGADFDLSEYQCFTDIQAKLGVHTCQGRSICEFVLMQKEQRFDLLNDFPAFEQWHKSKVEVLVGRAAGYACQNLDGAYQKETLTLASDSLLDGLSSSDVALLKTFFN